MKYILIISLALFTRTINAQSFSENKNQQIDSLTTKFKADSIHNFRFQKFRPYFNLDQRNSFIKEAPINVNGLQLGLLVKEKHVVGIGGYTITANSKQKVKTKSDKNVEVNKSLNLKYLTVFYQYVAIDKRYFELDIQGELGLGKYDLKLTNPNTNSLLLDRSAGMLVSGIGPIIAIKPFRWVGITGMAGYRLTFDKNPNLNFSGAYYGYGVWLDIRQIIRDIKFLFIKRNYKRKLMLLEKT